MATSRFQNLRVALASAITTQLTTDGTTGVTVTGYPPRGDQWTREDRVWLSEIRFNQEPYTQGSDGFREEELEVDLIVYCPTFGGTIEEQTAGEARAELILASIETAVRDDITVGSTVFNTEFASGRSHVGYVDDQGPFGYVEALIRAEAII